MTCVEIARDDQWSVAVFINDVLDEFNVLSADFVWSYIYVADDDKTVDALYGNGC